MALAERKADVMKVLSFVIETVPTEICYLALYPIENAQCLLFSVSTKRTLQIFNKPSFVEHARPAPFSAATNPVQNPSGW
jgi:hypothetical protein